MKIAVGWGTKDRGLLVGLLVGALTVGSALPHLAAYLGGADWRSVIVATSALALLGGLLVLLCGLGPHHARAPRFSTRAVALAWTNRRIRLTYLGYFGHMWELYAMWAWVGAAAAASYGALLGEAEATRLAKLTAFLAIALGGLTCAPAGWVADRIGKAQVTIIAMALSGSRRHRHRAQLRRADLADLRADHRLGNFRDPGFGAILGPGGGCLAARSRRQRHDLADRARLRAHRRDGAGDSPAGKRIRLASDSRRPRDRSGGRDRGDDAIIEKLGVDRLLADLKPAAHVRSR